MTCEFIERKSISIFIETFKKVYKYKNKDKSSTWSGIENTERNQILSRNKDGIQKILTKKNISVYKILYILGILVKFISWQIFDEILENQDLLKNKTKSYCFLI